MHFKYFLLYLDIWVPGTERSSGHRGLCLDTLALGAEHCVRVRMIHLTPVTVSWLYKEYSRHPVS